MGTLLQFSGVRLALPERLKGTSLILIFQLLRQEIVLFMEIPRQSLLSSKLPTMRSKKALYPLSKTTC
jgi:hypothetical protein